MHHHIGTDVIKVDRCPLLDARHAKLFMSVAGALTYLSGWQELGIERVGLRDSRRTRVVEIAL